MQRSNPRVGCAERPWEVFRQVLSPESDATAVEDFALQFGTPSDRDGGKAVWPICARKLRGTFSEVVGEARLHTDSQYREDPEGAFVLACIRPASQGGESILLSSKAAVEVAQRTLTSTELQLLYQPVWRWKVPSVFECREVLKETPLQPVFSPDGSIRWRDDNVICKSSEHRPIISKLSANLRASEELVTVRLEAGDVLLCDNKFALHGRTAFNDLSRLLYRVRLS